MVKVETIRRLQINNAGVHALDYAYKGDIVTLYLNNGTSKLGVILDIKPSKIIIKDNTGERISCSIKEIESVIKTQIISQEEVDNNPRLQPNIIH